MTLFLIYCPSAAMLVQSTHPLQRFVKARFESLPLGNGNWINTTQSGIWFPLRRIKTNYKLCVIIQISNACRQKLVHPTQEMHLNGWIGIGFVLLEESSLCMKCQFSVYSQQQHIYRVWFIKWFLKHFRVRKKREHPNTIDFFCALIHNR